MGKTKNPYILARLFPKKTNPKSRYYIKFSAWNESLNRLEERILWIPSKYKTDREKRVFAAAEIAMINADLIAGKCFAAGTKKEPVVICLLIPTLSELLETKKQELRSKSKATYASAFRKFKDFVKNEGLEKMPIVDFERKHAYKFRDYLLNNVGNNNTTINNTKTLICSLFFMAVERGYIPKNPFSKIPPLPETDSEANTAFSTEDQICLEEWLQKNDPVLYLFTRFLYHAFIRPKELRQLKGGQIDLERKTITIRGTIAKNKKTQTVPISSKLRECIGISAAIPPNKYLFGKKLVWVSDLPLSENYTYNRHKKALIETGLDHKGYTLYSWKHTGACRAIEAGVNPRKLQGLLRHSSLEETDIYLRSLGISLQNEELKETW